MNLGELAQYITDEEKAEQILPPVPEIEALIFDTVGRTSRSMGKNLLKKNGIFLSTNGSASKNVRDLTFLKELIEAGTIKPVIDRCWPLEQIVKAHR